MKWTMSPGAAPIQVPFAGDFTFFDQRLFFLRLKYQVPTSGGGLCVITTENTAVWTGN